MGLTGPRMLRRALAVLLPLLALAAPSTSLANGRSALANGVLVHPDAPTQMVLRNTFGLGISDDSGATWRWVCEQSIGYTGTYDPVVSFAPGGALLSSLPDQGLVRSTDGGCRFDAVRSLDDLVVSQLVWPGGQHAVYAAGRPLAGGSAVFVSTDGGATFTPTGNVTISDTSLVTGMLVVAGEGGADDTLYLSTAEFDGSVAQVHVSTDSGVSFTSHDFAGLGGKPSPQVVAVVDDGATLLVVATPRPGGNDWVLGRSSTGGASFETLASVTGPIFDFVVEGGVYLVPAGLLRVSTDDGQSFESLEGSPRAYCAGRTGTTVLSCGVNVLDGFSLARSEDQGATFEPVMSYADLGPPRCPEGTPTRDTCGALYPALRSQLDQLEAKPGDMGGTPDGGPGPDAADALVADSGDDTGATSDGAGSGDGGPARDTAGSDTGGSEGGGGGGCSLVSAPSDPTAAADGLLLLLLLGLATAAAGRRSRSAARGRG